MRFSNRSSWAVPGTHFEHQSTAAVCKTAGTHRSDISETGSVRSLGRRSELASTAYWSAATPRDETRPIVGSYSNAGDKRWQMAILGGTQRI